MAGVKGKSGGKRPGAGRPPKYNDCPTKVMRVPTYLAGHIRSLLDLAEEFTNYYAEDPKLCMLDEADEKKRKELVDLMSSMIDYENQRQRELRESAENHKLDKYMIPLFE